MNEEQQEELFHFLEHGDSKHRKWLRRAIKCFFNGEPRPIEDRTDDELRGPDVLPTTYYSDRVVQESRSSWQEEEDDTE